MAKTQKSESYDIWGTGNPLREFMHVDDLADALIFLLKTYNASGPINIGTGLESSIMDLAKLINEITNFKGRIQCDMSKPDGTPRKLMDSSKLHAMGWTSSIDLKAGIEQTHQWFLDNQGDFKN